MGEKRDTRYSDIRYQEEIGERARRSGAVEILRAAKSAALRMTNATFCFAFAFFVGLKSVYQHEAFSARHLGGRCYTGKIEGGKI
jgi:hypothetical protein